MDQNTSPTPSPEASEGTAEPTQQTEQFSQQPIEPVQPFQMSTPQTPTNLKPIWIGLLVLIVLAGGYVVYAKNQGLWPFEIVVAPTPSVSTTPDEMAGWKTYRNTKYGFEINIKSSWAPSVGPTSQNGNELVFLDNIGEKQFSIGILNNPNQLSVRDY